MLPKEGRSSEMGTCDITRIQGAQGSLIPYPPPFAPRFDVLACPYKGCGGASARRARGSRIAKGRMAVGAFFAWSAAGDWGHLFNATILRCVLNGFQTQLFAYK